MDDLLFKLLTIPAAVFAFSLKGYGEAFVSDKLGDPTPRNNGKLTMSPMAHIDVFGFLMIILFGFGWHKPVPTNSSFYKKVKRDSAFVALSGPVFLIVGAFAMAVIAGLLLVLLIRFNNSVLSVLTQIFILAVSLPLSLANFYLLPLPGLDGYRFLTVFAPYSWNEFLYKIERYQLLIFIVFILIIDFVPYVSSILFWPASVLSNLFLNIWTTVFGLIL